MVKRATKMEAKAKKNLQTEETERNSHTQGWLRVNGESEAALGAGQKTECKLGLTRWLVVIPWCG